MTREQLRRMLDFHKSPGPYVIGQPGSEASSLLEVYFSGWREAAAQANAAYRDWTCRRTPSSYSVYRASADRADAAQDLLAAYCRRG
jgi:hypothetical protein